MARRIPWEEIRLAYVQGVEREGKRVYPTQRELAAQYDVAISLIGRKAKEDSWSAQRDIFVSKVSAESERKTVEAVSDDAAEFNLLTFKAAQELSKRITERVIQPMTPGDAAQLASALRQAQQVGRLALGESTDKTDAAAALVIQLPEELRPGED